jgi:hypothetical protein
MPATWRCRCWPAPECSDLLLHLAKPGLSDSSGFTLPDWLRGKHFQFKLKRLELCRWCTSRWPHVKSRLDARCGRNRRSRRSASCGSLDASSHGCSRRWCYALNDLPSRSSGGCQANLAKIELSTNTQSITQERMRWNASLCCLDSRLRRSSLQSSSRNGCSSACRCECSNSTNGARNVAHRKSWRDSVFLLVDG